MADARQHHARLERGVVHAVGLHELLDDRLLVARVVDREAAREAEVVRLAAQQPGAQGVEGRDPHAPAVAVEQGADAVAHLLGGLVGEGHGEHLVERRVPLLDEVGDAMRDDARLARAGAGENQQRAIDVLDGAALLGIEGGEEVQPLYSTVTLLARFLGWSTSQPRRTAMWYESSCSGTVITIGARKGDTAGTATIESVVRSSSARACRRRPS